MSSIRELKDGLIEEINDDNLKINFMLRNGRRFYWRNIPDIQEVPKDGILCLIKSPPCPISSRYFIIDNLCDINLKMKNISSIKETLLKSGALAEMRARIRAEVFHMLKEDSELPPVLSNENLIINDLMREYLIYNGYLYTESVLLAESGQPQLQIQRNLIEEQLRIKANKEAGALPLLYGLISHVSKEDKPVENNTKTSEKR